MKYYLYLHYRQDKGEIFYVGIGTKSKTDLKYNYYKRAYSNKNRSKFWNNIIKLNPDYQIIILLESDNYDYIVYKEKELIDFYGRKDLNTGSLCNLTNGGEGTNGLKFNEELKLKWSKLAKLRAKYGKENHSSKPLYQYSLKGDFIKQCFSKVRIKKEKIKLIKKECFLCKEVLDINKFGLTGSGHYRKSCITCSNLKSVFNITRLEYIKLLKSQNYKCAICKKHESTIINNKVINLAVDHCHKTDKIRGLLCTNCNQGLGQFKDNYNNLSNAIKYLKKNEN